MKLIAVKGPTGSPVPILHPGKVGADTVTGLPGGLTLSVENIRNYAVFSVKYDPGKGLVLFAAIAMLVGLIGVATHPPPPLVDTRERRGRPGSYCGGDRRARPQRKPDCRV